MVDDFTASRTLTEGARTGHLQAPWGAYRPGRARQALLAASRSAKNTPVGRRLALETRRLARLGLHTPLDTETWGLKLRLFPRGNISEARLLFMPQLLDATERSFLAREARPGWVFLDVGANVGAYSYWVASLLKDQCRILAVEPGPEIHATLRFNLETNGLGQVTALREGVSAEAGTRWVDVNGKNRGETTLRPNRLRPAAGDGDHGYPMVEARPLHQILEREGVDRVDALKIDVEGAELETLSTFFSATRERRWPSVLVTEWKGTRDASSLARLLERTGYALKEATSLNRIYQRA